MRLTELYVNEQESEADLWLIIDRNAPAAMFNENQKRKILQFYVRARSEVMKTTKRANIGLRNLARALKMMRAAVKLRYPVIKAIFDALFTCFASHLDPAMQSRLYQIIW